VAKDDQQENYEKLLSTHHGRMIDFVKFAEAKNAALLTFCSVWIGSMITLLRADKPLPLGYDTAFMIVLPILVMAALISLSSFLPKGLLPFHDPGDGTKNLLYFGDIATLAIGTYTDRVRERYYPPADASYTDSYLADLLTQISVQSKIAACKFRRFDWAAWLVLGSIFIMGVPPVVAGLKWLARYGVEHGWL
jgi:hypothetical protein